MQIDTDREKFKILKEKIEELEKLKHHIENHMKLHLFLQESYYPDILVFSSTNRMLKQIRGFLLLIDNKSYECAVTILRCQIDTLMRLFGMTLCSEGIREYVYAFLTLKPENKISKLKDKHGHFLKDHYLIEKLNENSPGIKKTYQWANEFVHLTARHLITNSTAKFPNENNPFVEFTCSITSDDCWTTIQNYIDLTQNFLSVSERLLTEFQKYLKARESYGDDLKATYKPAG